MSGGGNGTGGGGEGWLVDLGERGGRGGGRGYSKAGGGGGLTSERAWKAVSLVERIIDMLCGCVVSSVRWGVGNWRRVGLRCKVTTRECRGVSNMFDKIRYTMSLQCFAFEGVGAKI